MKQRYEDTERTIYDFCDQFLVHCPRCDKCAQVVLRDKDDPAWEVKRLKGRLGYVTSAMFAPRRLICEHCSYTKDWHGSEVGNAESDGPRDWYFHQPLWLQIPCCGEVLWAFNEEHLDMLEDFVGAKLREVKPHGTLASRLPEWMKTAKHREEVLKCIQKLRVMLPAAI
jgi:hypothetical protein